MTEFINHPHNINKIVACVYVAPGSGATIHKHRPSHGLAFHMSGEKDYHFDDNTVISVKGGDIIYLPKQSSYEVVSKLSGDCFAINFDLDEDITFPPASFHIKNQRDIKLFFSHATKIWNLKTAGYLEKCKSELYDILYNLISEYHSKYIPSKKYEIIKPGVEYIHHNYLTENISIEKLSSLCKVSPEYFRKIFKNFYGISPIKYINNLKIEHAKELIESEMYSVSESAFQSGYIDVSHFSREFKKITGFAPNEYKSANRK